MQVQETTDQVQLTVDELARFFGVLAHDLKSPIFSIDGFSDLLLADYAGKIDAEGEDFLRRIRSSAQQMKKVLDDMCHIVKLVSRPVAQTPVNLHDLFDELRLKHSSLFADASVDIVLAPDLPLLETDPELLKELLGVLLKNAVFFSDRSIDQRTVLMEVTRVSEGIRFSVTDNGIGIDPRYAAQIFELGIKMDKSRGGGPGYGLFLGRKIAMMLGGNLEVSSELNAGSTFSFVLPA